MYDTIRVIHTFIHIYIYTCIQGSPDKSGGVHDALEPWVEAKHAEKPSDPADATLGHAGFAANIFPQLRKFLEEARPISRLHVRNERRWDFSSQRFETI